jgi:hypothetical protein
MHRSPAIVLLLFLTTGCAVIAPDEPVAPKPEVAAAQPAAQPLPAAKPPPDVPGPAPQAESKVGAPGTKPPVATKPPAASAPVAPRAKPPTPPAPAAAPALDLNALKEQLKETQAIGTFTKLTLKNQVDDLLQQFREYYDGSSKRTMAQLRRSYDLLLMKVLSLLQDADPKLASAIVSSREAIWGLLADPKRFATLQV